MMMTLICVMMLQHLRSGRPMTEGQRIHHELQHQEELCTCQRQFRINKIGEGKYCVCLHAFSLHVKQSTVDCGAFC